MNIKNHLRTVAGRSLAAAGWELRRASDPALPSLREFELFGESFSFWIANPHTDRWWGRGVEGNAELRWQRDACRPGGTAVDVGGHHGMNALLFARSVGPDGRVLVAEADPGNSLVVHANLGANGLKNTTVRPVAVGASEGEVSFNKESVGDGGRVVPKLTLDGMLSDWTEYEPGRPIDLLKIDVEGFELEVLAGGAATVRAARCVSLELHLDLLGRYGAARDAVLEHLPLDHFDVQALARPDWNVLRTISHWDELPAAGVVNLFLTRRDVA